MSSYLNKVLLKGEEVVYKGHRHWIVFASPFFWLVIGLSIMYALPGMHLLELVAFVMMFFSLAGAIIDYTQSEIIVTNRRVLVKIGWLSCDAVETLLENVSSVRVEQTVMGRFLNYGSLIISDRGSMQAPFLRVADPFFFRRKVHEEQINQGFPVGE